MGRQSAGRYPRDLFAIAGDANDFDGCTVSVDIGLDHVSSR